MSPTDALIFFAAFILTYLLVAWLTLKVLFWWFDR